MASDHTWWCEDRPNGAFRSPDRSSVTYPSAPWNVRSAFAIKAW